MKGGPVPAAALAGARLDGATAAPGRERSGAGAARTAASSITGSAPARARRAATLAGAAVALTALVPAPARAQNTHILLISGLGGEARYTAAFHGWLSRFADAATEKYGVPPARITYLGEKPDLDPTRIRARSTAGNIRSALAAIAAAMAPADDLVVLLAGHGTFRDRTARFNIPGPDLTPADMDVLLAGLGDRRVTFVNTASASGPFVEALSGPNRTIITATRSGRERNLTRFGLHFADAFAGDGADTDKDSRVSMLEAFGYALREVEREYESGNLLMTEHAVLDDNGDGEGSREPDELDGDGALARTVFLVSAGGAAGGAETTPGMLALYHEKAAIEARIADLRRVKAQMSLERYENELEELLVELALKNREIRAAGSGGDEAPPVPRSPRGPRPQPDAARRAASGATARNSRRAPGYSEVVDISPVVRRRDGRNSTSSRSHAGRRESPRGTAGSRIGRGCTSGDPRCWSAWEGTTGARLTTSSRG